MIQGQSIKRTKLNNRRSRATAVDIHTTQTPEREREREGFLVLDEVGSKLLL